ncbi:ribosomal protein S19e [Ramicandelaber brevisporus]|nr:ribosomal protein S19e [Ramicandelaber brevisporus]
MGITVKDVPAQAFIKAYAEHLKRSGKFPVPKWTDLVKTATHKELGPYDADWFYIRAAAVARQLYIHGGIGTGRLQKRFGGRARRGTRPNKTHESSGSVARKVLQALEKVSVLEKDSANGGRKVTSAGQRDLDRIASQVNKAVVAAAAAAAAAIEA